MNLCAASGAVHSTQFESYCGCRDFPNVVGSDSDNNMKLKDWSGSVAMVTTCDSAWVSYMEMP